MLECTTLQDHFSSHYSVENLVSSSHDSCSCFWVWIFAVSLRQTTRLLPTQTRMKRTSCSRHYPGVPCTYTVMLPPCRFYPQLPAIQSPLTGKTTDTAGVPSETFQFIWETHTLLWSSEPPQAGNSRNSGRGEELKAKHHQHGSASHLP